MDKTVFEAQAVSIFHGHNYIFYDELQHGETIQQMSASYKTGMLAASALAGLGAFVIKFANFTDNEVEPELKKLGTYCDLIGIKISTIAQLVLFIYADELSDEAIVGKSCLIRDRLNSFKKFTMRVSWTKMPVFANVFFIFSASEKSFHFRQQTQSHCKHHAFLGKTYVLPWGIDLSAKSVWPYKGLPTNQFKPSDLEAKFFRD